MSDFHKTHWLYFFHFRSTGPVWSEFGKCEQKCESDFLKALLRIKRKPYIIAIIGPIFNQSESISIIASIAMIAINFQISNAWLHFLFYNEVFLRKILQKIERTYCNQRGFFFECIAFHCLLLGVHQERSGLIISPSNFFIRDIVQYRATQYRTLKIEFPPPPAP